MPGGLSNLILTYTPIPLTSDESGNPTIVFLPFLDVITLTPLWNNIISALLTVIYVKSILEVGSFLREHLGCAYESRKFVHMGAACWILFWPLFDVVHWSWRLNILVPAVMSIKLFYKVS